MLEADVVLVPKESTFSDVDEYKHVSITLVLSKVFKKIATGKMSHFF